MKMAMTTPNRETAVRSEVYDDQMFDVDRDFADQNGRCGNQQRKSDQVIEHAIRTASRNVLKAIERIREFTRLLLSPVVPLARSRGGVSEVVLLERTSHRRQRDQPHVLAAQCFESRILMLLWQNGAHHVTTYSSLSSQTLEARRNRLSAEDNLNLSFGLRGQFRDCPDSSQLTLVDDADAVAQRFRVREDMRGKEDRLTLGPQLLDQFPHLAAPMGSSPDIGSSRKTSFGSCRIACASPPVATCPSKTFATDVPAESISPMLVQHLLHSRRAGLWREPQKFRIIIQQFAGAQMVVKVGLFGKKSNLRFHLRIVHVHAQNPGASCGRKHQPISSLRVWFSRAVWAEEAENFSFFDGQAERPEREFRTLAPEPTR